jgi:hypothetical protein
MTRGKVYLLKRNAEALDDYTKHLIDLITIGDNVKPVGSFQWKVHQYPGDIDIFEKVVECCDELSASDLITTELKNIARQVKNDPDIFWGDFKAGLDDRFRNLYKSIGSYNENTNQLKTYRPNRIRTELNKLLQNQLLTQSELTNIYKKMDHIKKSNKSNLETVYESLKEYIRSYYILRWSENDIITGYKLLKGGQQKTVQDALDDESVVKLDLWAKLDGKYNEITNFFLLVAKNPKTGVETIINQDLGNYLDNIEKDISKYASYTHRNSLKLAKRLWNKAAWVGDDKMMNKLYPLFASDAARLNSVNAESEVLRFMIEKLPTQDLIHILPIITNQVQNFAKRIDDVIEIEIPAYLYERLFENIQQIVTLMKSKNFYESEDYKNLVVKSLKNNEKILQNVIEKYSDTYLKKNISFQLILLNPTNKAIIIALSIMMILITVERIFIKLK